MSPGIALQVWLEERRRACRLEVRAIRWRDSDSWSFRDGRLVHVTGGFFAVVGVRSVANISALDGLMRPIIDQPEIGILGFMVRCGPAGPEWLVQAKAEPGNIGVVQLAPSVQATRSNFTRLHGGAPTPYLETFTRPESGGRPVADSLQSEQGNRFLGKYNRNMTVLVDGDGPEPCAEDWRWVAAAELRAMLAIDFAVNTDARSVLFCSDWNLLAGGLPFARWHGCAGWGLSLLESFAADPAPNDAPVLDWLQRQRAAVALEVSTIPLESMPDWELTAGGIASRADGVPLVEAYAVEANSREVDHWDQPFVMSRRQESVVQLCQRRAGVLRFLLRASVELGFSERVQIGPTWQSDDQAADQVAAGQVDAASGRGTERHSSLQSDEGGRFFHSICRYRIVELPADEVFEMAASNYLWASLGQIYRLSRIKGVFSNEARSALSMLLADL
jgi:oxidase EvaA